MESAADKRKTVHLTCQIINSPDPKKVLTDDANRPNRGPGAGVMAEGGHGRVWLNEGLGRSPDGEGSLLDSNHSLPFDVISVSPYGQSVIQTPPVNLSLLLGRSINRHWYNQPLLNSFPGEVDNSFVEIVRLIMEQLMVCLQILQLYFGGCRGGKLRFGRPERFALVDQFLQGCKCLRVFHKKGFPIFHKPKEVPGKTCLE